MLTGLKLSLGEPCVINQLIYRPVLHNNKLLTFDCLLDYNLCEGCGDLLLINEQIANGIKEFIKPYIKILMGSAFSNTKYSIYIHKVMNTGLASVYIYILS